MSQQLTNFFFFSILSCPLSFFLLIFRLLYIYLFTIIATWLVFFLSLSLFLSLLSVFLSVHTLYTLSANAAGNRTLCDLCQAKYQRKQTRHRERKIVEHEAAEELDGTREHRKREQLICRPDLLLLLFFFFFFLYCSTDLDYVPDSPSSVCTIPRTSLTSSYIIYLQIYFHWYFYKNTLWSVKHNVLYAYFYPISFLKMRTTKQMFPLFFFRWPLRYFCSQQNSNSL